MSLASYSLASLLSLSPSLRSAPLQGYLHTFFRYWLKLNSRYKLSVGNQILDIAFRGNDVWDRNIFVESSRPPIYVLAAHQIVLLPLLFLSHSSPSPPFVLDTLVSKWEAMLMTATAPACCAQWVKRRARAKSLNTQPCNNSEADHTLPSYTTAFPERLEATWEGEGEGERRDAGVGETRKD